jgi:AcrR family transcriptional regulator
MKQDKRDRRSQRTQRLVIAAMTELLAEKRYEAITIQDILDRAGIGRSTFYAHYFDKEDVQAAVMKEMLETLKEQLAQRNAGQSIVPSLELFRHIQEHHRRFQAMVRGHAGDWFWEMMQTALSRTIEQSLAGSYTEKQSPAVPLPVAAQYLAGAFLTLLKWWLSAEMPYSPEQMDAMFQQLALPGVWTILERR